MGGIKKMKILVFSDPEFKKSVSGSPIELQINPEKYTHNHEVSYDLAQGIGTSGTSIKFLKITPEKVNFDIYLDGTGVIQPVEDVASFIQNFKSLVYDYNGKIHSSNYLELNWGQSIFRCRLTKMDITYSMFKPDGDPLRASMSLSFEEFLDARYIILEEKSSSPDLTHLRMVKAGDTLPEMCYEIYGDFSYYIAVAEVNNLNDFRDLEAGQLIKFPPIKEEV